MRRTRMLSVFLAVAMLVSLLAGAVPAAAAGNPYEPTEHVTHDGATFGRATVAYNYTADLTTVSVAGMPLFNGNAADFDAYIGLLLKEIGDAGIIALAGGGTATGSYVKDGQTVTYTIPAGSSVGGEALMGAAGQTELSTVMYQAQSWNKELINDIGYLMGSENKSKKDNGGYNWTSSTGTSMTDMRLNPLSGRYDEGYGEDSTMASIFADLNARGYNGYDGDQSGFYIMASVNTKHYTVYNAQWFRPLTSTQVGVRSFYEYNAKSANRGWANGTFSSFMSSYGRINGVPSSASFITAWADSLGPYSVYTGTDAGADTPYLDNSTQASGMSPAHVYGEWSNGYDMAYSPNVAYKAASMAVSGHRASGGADVLAQAVADGLNGITVADCLNAAIAYLTIRTRTGIYDEKDANGLSKFYPFNDVAANGAEKASYESSSSQAVALRNAQEGIVLLKNENSALPMSADASVGVYGPFAKAVNSGIYAVAVSDYTGRGDEAGNSAYESIALRDADASFDLGLNKVTIQVGGKYLYVDPADTQDGILALKSAEEYTVAEDKSGYYFGILDNGQDASSIYAYGNGRWLRAIISDPTTDFDAIVGKTGPLPFHGLVSDASHLVVADEDCGFKQSPNQGLPPMLSGYPYHFVLESAGAAGEYYIRAGAKVNGVTFITGVAALMDKHYGYYLEAQGTILGLGGGQIGDKSESGAGLTYFASLMDKSNLTFTISEIEPYGYAATAAAAADDYAVIFVGQSYLGLSGEGTDRVTLEMGASQIESALKVAKTYKDAGKKTVAVVYANYPVVVEALQTSDDVDAIIFAGYGGQYGGKATAQVLFGEYAPTGRLVSTWYKDMDLFPQISEYSLPVASVGRGRDTMEFLDGFDLDADIDERITVDMTNADVIDTGLTYKYLTDAQTAAHVTYPFGYGLSYSSFAYSNLRVANNGGAYRVSVDVQNTGSVDTSEVVQIYMSKTDSAYGDAVAVKSLAGFEKVALAAGEKKTVTIDVDPLDIAVWDVNAEKYVVESGAYTLYAAHDSSLSGALQTTVQISGDALAALPINVVNNVWEHSFNFENVHFDEYSKLQTAASAAAEGVNDDTFAVMAKGAGAWTAIPKVSLNGITSATLTVGAPAGVSGKIELRLDSPSGTKIGEVTVASTGGVTKTLLANTPENAATITELGYNTVSTDVSATGTHNLYLVFSAKDLHVGTIQLNTYVPGPTAPGGSTEPDTSGDKAPAYVEGMGDGTFNPNGQMTRAAVATILYRLYDGEITGSKSFTDVEQGKWYYEAVTKLAYVGIIDGYADGSFKPDAPITRAEFAALIARFADLAENPAACRFSDVSETSWARGYIGALVAEGWVGGYEDGSFRPGNNLTRAEGVKMINAMLGRTATDAELAAANGLITFSDVPSTHWAYREILLAANAYPLS